MTALNSVLKQPVFFTQNTLAYFLTFCVILTSWLLAFSSLPKVHPEFYAGITYDLILTAPLVLYFVSKRTVPKLIVGWFISFGILSVYFLVPKSEQFHFNLLRFYLLPACEFLAFFAVIRFLRKTIQQAKSVAGETDYFTVFYQSAIKVTGSERFGAFFGTELALFYYTFFSWKRNKPAANTFTYHKNSGIIGLVWVVIFMISIESVVLHILLENWNPIIAWVLTGLSCYTLIIFIAHLKAIKLRQHVVHEDYVELKNGVYGNIVLHYSEIERIELSSKDFEEEGFTPLRFALFGELESHNCVIYLKEKQKFQLIYGIKREGDVMLLNVDNKDEFKKYIDTFL